MTPSLTAATRFSRSALIALERERYDEALAAAEGSLAIAEKRGRSIEEFTCHELLSRIQEKRGDTAAALAHHRTYHELERVRVNEETATRLANLQVKHEVATARKDAEIHRLRSLALQQEVEQQRIAQTQLEAQASLDPLTGLFNRRHVSVLAEDLDRELVQGRQASVILFDIDRFKEINDTHGHFAGDRALVAIARLLRENARDSDTPVRYGGDEFLVLLSGTGTEKARDMAERLRLAIATTAHRAQGRRDPADRQRRRRDAWTPVRPSACSDSSSGPTARSTPRSARDATASSPTASGSTPRFGCRLPACPRGSRPRARSPARHRWRSVWR